MKVSAGTIARTICLILAIANQILAIVGKEAIRFVEADIYQIVSLGFTAVTAIAAWWKNNSFTEAAKEADKLLTKLKSGEK